MTRLAPTWLENQDAAPQTTVWLYLLSTPEGWRLALDRRGDFLLPETWRFTDNAALLSQVSLLDAIERFFVEPHCNEPVYFFMSRWHLRLDLAFENSASLRAWTQAPTTCDAMLEIMLPVEEWRDALRACLQASSLLRADLHQIEGLSVPRTPAEAALVLEAAERFARHLNERYDQGFEIVRATVDDEPSSRLAFLEKTTGALDFAGPAPSSDAACVAVEHPGRTEGPRSNTFAHRRDTETGAAWFLTAEEVAELRDASGWVGPGSPDGADDFEG